jgi:2-keto-4-pentenoate hydratase
VAAPALIGECFYTIMEASEIHEAARWLCQARLHAEGVVDCPHGASLHGEDDGYAVQERLRDALAVAGLGGLVGYKIGCTNAAVQQMIGVPGPAFGGLMAANRHDNGATFALDRFQKPGVECEIAIWLGDDFGPAGAPFGQAAVASHVAACSVAMEIVDNRYGDFRTAPLGLMIADDFFQAACVVGPRIEDWRALDLAELTGWAHAGGEPVGTGKGHEVMELGRLEASFC